MSAPDTPGLRTFLRGFLDDDEDRRLWIPAAGSVPAVEEDFLPEIVADRYRDLTPIGAGGMAVVYRATDTWENRPVALKALRCSGGGEGGGGGGGGGDRRA